MVEYSSRLDLSPGPSNRDSVYIVRNQVGIVASIFPPPVATGSIKPK